MRCLGMWFDRWQDLWRVGVTTLVIYAALIVILRGAGKRSLAKLNIFDLVVTVALGSTLAAVMLNKDVSLAEGAVAFVALVGLQWIVTALSVRSKLFKRIIRAEARILLRDGEFFEDAMRSERVTKDEVEAAIRKDGHGRIEDIAAVVLETDGSFSVISGGKAEDCSALRSVNGARV